MLKHVGSVLNAPEMKNEKKSKILGTCNTQNIQTKACLLLYVGVFYCSENLFNRNSDFHTKKPTHTNTTPLKTFSSIFIEF